MLAQPLTCQVDAIWGQCSSAQSDMRATLSARLSAEYGLTGLKADTVTPRQIARKRRLTLIFVFPHIADDKCRLCRDMS